MKLHERIFELALIRSFFYPSNEIYGSSAGFYDYGPSGLPIKNKIQELWRNEFIKKNGFLEMDTGLVTPEIVLQASGHVNSITDPVASCANCGAKVRADYYLEEKKKLKWNGGLDQLKKLFADNNLKCPSCGKEFKDIYMFNLMFKTGIGGEEKTAYLRPETAQGLFVNFLRLFRNHGATLPLAVGQIGKSFRNEISPRRGLVRMREFTQMELEYFYNPENTKIDGFEEVKKNKIRVLADGSKNIEWKTGEELVNEKICDEIGAYFLIKEWEFYKKCNIDEKRMYFRVLSESERPHYSSGNIDLEVETSYGNIETIGNAYRTDHDLKSHTQFSKKDHSVVVNGKKILPHVFEISMGVDRLLFCMLEHNFRDKTKEKEWEWFDLPPLLAPYQVAVFPLMKKDGLPEKAIDITNKLRDNFDVYYYKSGSIGRRYAKADEIGVPYAITVDYDTLKDNTVTLRYRNDGKQERVPIAKLKDKLLDNIHSGKVVLK